MLRYSSASRRRCAGSDNGLRDKAAQLGATVASVVIPDEFVSRSSSRTVRYCGSIGTAGKLSARVVAQPIFPSSTRIAATVAVIDLVSDPMCHWSSPSIGSAWPSARTPTKPDSKTVAGPKLAAASAGRRWLPRMSSS